MADLFRFMTIRPSQRVDREGSDIQPIRTYNTGLQSSNLHTTLRTTRTSSKPRQGMVKAAKDFINSPQFSQGFAGVPDTFKQFEQKLANEAGELSLKELGNLVTRVFGASANELISKQDFTNNRQRIADSVIAASIASGETTRIRPELMSAMRVFGLLERVAKNDASLNRPGAIRHALNAPILLPGDVFPVPPGEPSLRKDLLDKFKKAKKAVDERRQQAANLAAHLAELESSLDNLSQEFAADILEERKTGSTADTALPALGTPPANAATVLAAPAASRSFVLSKRAADRLSPVTNNILTQLKIPSNFIDVPKASAAIESEIVGTASRLYSAESRRRITTVGNANLSTDVFAPPLRPGLDSPLIPGLCDPPPPETPVVTQVTLPEGAGSIRPIGIADLMVVEQQILKYEAGEVAHIENVLRGELKERRHRRTTTTEESILIETERTEETERDLQTTERFELQVEAQQTISQDTSTQAGVTSTGKFGPSLEVTANTNFAFNQAREESQRAATTFARDVTERAVSRIQERVLERRFRRTVEEVEEINTHTLDNRASTEHTIGIYRWVDKLYRAQVVNYGRRMMFEFVVPEPAAFFRYASSTQPAEGSGIEKPDPPGYCLADRSTFVPLSPKDLSPSNYLFWVGKYEVPNVDPPPPRFSIVTAAFDQPSVQNNLDTKSTTNLKVPQGYVAKYAYTKQDRAFKSGAKSELHVFVGRKRAEGDFITLDDEDSAVPIAIIGINMLAYVVTVEILCQRAEEALQAWQIATYNAIMTVYNQQKAAFEDQLAAAEVQRGVAIRGRNPLINREIEKTELKKASISMLTGQQYDLFDAMRRNASLQGYPQMDLAEAAVEGSYIQFFEQAFEWVNMMYIFYPYFWGRKEEWPALLALDDNDPLFGRFLQAGAARVQVPVRPGFEEAVLHYVESGGEIWDGGDPPHIDDDLFISIVDEVREQQGADGKRREGALTVTQGSPDVTGVGTNFVEDDLDRRISIETRLYRIAAVASPTRITLSEAYREASRTGARYTVGGKYVGEPWEVRVPTTLVYLQKDSQLPDFTLGENR